MVPASDGSRHTLDSVLVLCLCIAAIAAWIAGCAPDVASARDEVPWQPGQGPVSTGGASGAPSGGGAQQGVPGSGAAGAIGGGGASGVIGAGGIPLGAGGQPSGGVVGGVQDGGPPGASSGGGSADAGGRTGPWSAGIPVPASPQEPGDPSAGFEYLANGGYFGCGIPERFFGLASPFATLPGISSEALPGRNVMVNGAPLPYTWNRAKNADGLDVIYMNCLQCHAGKFNGKLIIGLGNADADWTTNLANMSGAANLLGLLGPTPDEQKEFDRFIGRLKVIGGPAVMKTVGTNPAEMLATTFVSHRDRDTLTWSDTPFFKIPALENAPAGTTITSKTPPWWRMSKKNGQFYNGMGRGDHRRSEMLAGSLCTDSVPEAQAIDAHFNDVAAYITSIKAPAYPFAIDHTLADEGSKVFAAACAGCHGNYGPDPVTYPNLLIPIEEVRTDPAVALGGTSKDYGSDLVDWYNNSWYGQIGHYVPFKGYVAPPLDGVWATAPYLHNGSVPDIATLLDSRKRPKYWRRLDHDTTHYEQDDLGFPWAELQSGQAAPPLGVAAKDIYDTDQFSHSNTGHTYGDSLTDDQRLAVTEYLKTL